MRCLVSTMVGLSLAVSAAAVAQDEPPSPAPAPLLERLPQLLEDLELSPEQRRQVDETIGEIRRELHELRREARDVPPRERIGRTQELLRELRDEVMAALDEEQRDALRGRIERFQEHWRETAPVREQVQERMVHRLREAMRQLELTPDQREEIDEIFDRTREQMQEMQRRMEEEMHRRREEVRQLFEQTREELHDVLTPEQRQRLRELLPPRPRPAADEL